MVQHGLLLEPDLLERHARHEQRRVGRQRVPDGLGDEGDGAGGARVGLDDVDVLVLDAVLDVEEA